VSEIRLIVGLGNPGREYENTRHNIGFMVLDRLAQQGRTPFEPAAKWECAYAKRPQDGSLLVKPLTFMNLSGRSIGKIMRFHKWTPEQMLVVYDDAALDLGRLRIREKGSHGGHNGVRSLIEHLGTDVFPRIKVGIGSGAKRRWLAMFWANFSNQSKKLCKTCLPWRQMLCRMRSPEALPPRQISITQ